MEELKQLEKMIQSINIELGAFAILKKEGKPSIHSNQYYIHLVTTREYLNRAFMYLKQADNEARIEGNVTIQ